MPFLWTYDTFLLKMLEIRSYIVSGIDIRGTLHWNTQNIFCSLRLWRQNLFGERSKRLKLRRSFLVSKTYICVNRSLENSLIVIDTMKLLDKLKTKIYRQTAKRQRHFYLQRVLNFSIRLRWTVSIFSSFFHTGDEIPIASDANSILCFIFNLKLISLV